MEPLDQLVQGPNLLGGTLLWMTDDRELQWAQLNGLPEESNLSPDNTLKSVHLVI